MADFGGRIDSASRVIKASPRTVYLAFMDPKAVVSWLPPKGMKARLEAYDPCTGGTWTLTAVPEGTEVSIRCENVPEGIRPEDHRAGFRSTLEHLAAFTEER